MARSCNCSATASGWPAAWTCTCCASERSSKGGGGSAPSDRCSASQGAGRKVGEVMVVSPGELWPSRALRWRRWNLGGRVAGRLAGSGRRRRGSAPARFLVVELLLRQLAHRRLGQLGADLHRLHHLVLAEALLEESLQLGERE